MPPLRNWLQLQLCNSRPDNWAVSITDYSCWQTRASHTPDKRRSTAALTLPLTACRALMFSARSMKPISCSTTSSLEPPGQAYNMHCVDTCSVRSMQAHLEVLHIDPATHTRIYSTRRGRLIGLGHVLSKPLPHKQGMTLKTIARQGHCAGHCNLHLQLGLIAVLNCTRKSRHAMVYSQDREQHVTCTCSWVSCDA